MVGTTNRAIAQAWIAGRLDLTRFLFLSLICALGLVSVEAKSAPEAHILRIDPRTAVLDGHPVLTAVIDISESARIGEVTSACASLRGDEQLDCISTALEKPGALAKSYPLPEKDLLFTVRVGDTDFPADLLSVTPFGKRQDEPRVGTAWLILVDADDRIGKGLGAANAVAKQFLSSMGPHDLANLIYLSDRQVILDTRWLSRAELNTALSAVEKQSSTVRSQGRTRPLLDLIKNAASDSFRALGNPGQTLKTPLHQAMVVLSTGYGGGDPATTGPGATQLASYFTNGRFDEGNTALPKLPTPVISIYLPPKALDEHKQIAQSFMQNLANPQMGGFFTVLREGQNDHAGRIVDAVRSRFSAMHLARFKLSCVAPTTTQSFSLLFKGGGTEIAGDSSYKDVPVGFDPKEWPLDIDSDLTRKNAEKSGGVFPGGTVKVFGQFCWGTDTARPEVYFLPPGEALPQDLSENAKVASEVQKRLTSLDMRGTAIAANSSFAEFKVPDTDQILHGEGERRIVRLVVVDSKMRRTSGLTATTVLTLKGAERPDLLTPWIYAGAGGFFLLVLLALILRRSSRRSVAPQVNKRSLAEESPYATPAPVSRIPRPEQQKFRAILEGPSGRFTVLPDSDLRAGRDGSRCAAVLSSPQVSGLHATFRMDGEKLLVRDEGSTSGTRIDGQSIRSGIWEPAHDSSEVSLGPEVLRVTLSRLS